MHVPLKVKKQFVLLHAYVFCLLLLLLFVAVFCCCGSLFGSVSYSLRLPSFSFHIWECYRNLLSNFTRIIKYSLVSVLD